MASPPEECFMQSPLVIWIDTFREANSPAIQYKDIYGGVFLTTVMNQITQGFERFNSGDPQTVYSKVNTNISDVNARIQNWDNLVKNIKAYYLEVLQQILIMRLPNIQLVCREPEKDASFEELKKALLLVLGCAVQCERKEYFIEKIKTLDIKVQQAIVELIKEVTDDTQTVLPTGPSEQLDVYLEKSLNHLNKLIIERDELAEAVSELKQEQEIYQSQIEGNTTWTTGSPEKHHLVVELADCKAKVRRLRQELEEKTELLSDVMDELDDNKSQLQKTKTEYNEIYQEAKTARAYRDEIDMLREKAVKVESYENEILKYKEKLNELEFCRSRIDELKEDNRILVETRSMLEEQISNTYKRMDAVKELERDLMKCKNQMQELTLELDTEKEKVRVLTEENALLEFEKKNRLQQNTTLEKELEEAHTRTSGISLSDQLNETSNAKVLRLELENQLLQQKIEELRENSLLESSALNLEQEKENKRLSKKVESLQGEMKSQSERCIELEQKTKEFADEKEKLLLMIETVKENTERQLNEVKREKEHLAETISSLRERNEKSNDSRVKELEKENKNLHDKVSETAARISKLDFEYQQLQRANDKMKANCERLNELEHSNTSLERINSDLKNAVSTLKLACDKYETTEEDNSRLEIENKKLNKTIESLQLSLSKQEMLIEEHISLTLENQKLQKTLESLKGATDKVLELDNEKDELNREIQQLKKTIESQRIERVKYEQMEMDVLDMDNENQKLQKTLEMTTRRLQQLEKDNNDLEVENEKLQISIESLKLSCKKLENKEEENKELDNEIIKLNKDKSALEKENKKLKHVLEATGAHLDEITSKHNILEKDYKALKKTLDKNKDANERIREFEKENKDLQQQLLVNKKTLATLREDLVNEKIQMQQLLNEREKLGQELEQIGLKREELMKNHESDESRFQIFENMMQDAIKKNTEIKEDKILSLESRLEESKNRNMKLQEELRSVKRDCESLKQRLEEEFQDGNTSSVVNISNPTRQILEIKDRVVEVERDNATLLAENKNLKRQLEIIDQQIAKKDNDYHKLQYQLSTLHEQNNTSHSQHAKIEVENKTLQTQCTSLQAQNSTLQSQLNNADLENERNLQRIEELQNKYDSLVSAHETLQKLHDDLTTEYESLISEHGSLKTTHKSSCGEMKDLQDQLSILLRGKNDITKLREMLEKEREQLKVESKSLSNLQMDYNHMRNKYDNLHTAYERLEKEHQDLGVEYKRIKTEYNDLQLRYTELQGDAAESREQLSNTDLEMTKLATRCEAIDQMNQKMEEENNQLLYQMKTLINQNQELLSEALNSKDQHAETAKAYQEKFAELRRQKERLEEKIMEHYKMRLESPKKRSLGATLVRKARGIITRVHRTKSKTNLTNSESPDNSSVGSGSCGEAADADSNSGRRITKVQKTNEKAHEVSFVKQNKSFMMSTTLLFYKLDSNNVRGSRSSEDLVNFDSASRDGTYSLGGKMADVDDDYHRSPSTIHGRQSPGSELLTLEQFLKESNPDSPTLRTKGQERKLNEGVSFSQSEQLKRNKISEGSSNLNPGGKYPVRTEQDHYQRHVYEQSNQNSTFNHSNSSRHLSEPYSNNLDPSSKVINNSHQELSKVSRSSSNNGESTGDSKTDLHSTYVQPVTNKDGVKTPTPKVRRRYPESNYFQNHRYQTDSQQADHLQSQNSVSQEPYIVLRSAKSYNHIATQQAPQSHDLSNRSVTPGTVDQMYAPAHVSQSMPYPEPHYLSREQSPMSDNRQSNFMKPAERPTSMHFNNQPNQGPSSRPTGSASPFPKRPRDSPNLYKTDPTLSKSELSLNKRTSRSPEYAYDNAASNSQTFNDYHSLGMSVDKPTSSNNILEICEADESYPYRSRSRGTPPKPINRDPNNYTHTVTNNSNHQDTHQMLPTSSSSSSLLQSQAGYSRNSSAQPSYTGGNVKNAPMARISPQTKQLNTQQHLSLSNATTTTPTTTTTTTNSNSKSSDESKDPKTNSVWKFQ
ncbi:girdin isoform X1 [Octopus bimaculoides]|nr:girdin isoform X1 [Octopus bimaculoides]